MILKAYDNIPYIDGHTGWVFIDKIEKIRVDNCSWVLTRDIDNPTLPIVCRIFEDGINRSEYLEYTPLFEEDDFIKDFENDNEYVRVKVIHVIKDDNSEIYVSPITKGGSLVYLLNDEGRTVERL